MSVVNPELITQVMTKQSLEDDATKFALDYFAYFFHDPTLGAITEEQVKEYTVQFQEMVGVEVDGNLDTKVIREMQTMPRCGVKDYSTIEQQAAGVASWKNGMNITYFIESYVGGLSQADQNDLIKLSWKQWSDVADLKFSQVATKAQANIVISTGRGAGSQFDGPSGTLAWAYLPPQPNFTGQLLMRFDLDETWIRNVTDRGILYLNVATHEFGHLLGLAHSKQSKALMAPYYAVGITKPQAVDDIPRILSIYGAPVAPPPAPPPPPGTPPADKIKVEIYINSLDDIKVMGKQVEDFVLI